jgi:ribosomal-protein-alanine N-acetyltransferase
MAAILAIERASFGADAYPESLFRLYDADQRTLFLVAEAGKQIKGYIIARCDRWGAEIVSLAVHPAARKRGVGRTLLTAAVNRMRRRNAHSIRLMVHVKNTQAALFYHGLGFRKTARVVDYYEDGGMGIRMRLALKKPSVNS